MSDVKCPICDCSSEFKYSITAKYIKERLSNHFFTSIPKDVEILDYKLMLCNNCFFEFAFPQIEGSSSFYNWITEQVDYYPKDRWEYYKINDLIEHGFNKKLLDVGCGDGKFFDAFLKVNNSEIELIGIDPTVESIQKCIKKGYTAYSMNTQTFKEAYPDILFDYIVSFHCLEHIANPTKFIEELSSLLNRSGSLLISTPYSPMTIEIGWFDVLNHPPHHLGRWNKKSYQRLADSLDLTVEFFAPEPGGILASTMESFLMSEFDMVFSRIENPKRKLIEKTLQKPLKFIKHLFKQTFRERLLEKTAPNVVLVKFTKK
jgi:2-polyprenyl-3-methyl-5-hydroxy-6-metoxy-1,4-benzoquinol methylase